MTVLKQPCTVSESSLSFGAFSSSVFLFSPLLQQTKKIGRMFIQNKHLFDTQDSGCSPSLN